MPYAKWTAPRRRAFLQTLAETGNVSAAARASRLSRSRAYDLKAADPAFAAGWEEALEEAIDRLEAEARRRALDGVAQPRFHQGRVTGTVRRYSDALLMFLLRAHRPETYRENSGERNRDTSEAELADSRARLAERLARLDPADDAGGAGAVPGKPE